MVWSNAEWAGPLPKATCKAGKVGEGGGGLRGWMVRRSRGDELEWEQFTNGEFEVRSTVNWLHDCEQIRTSQNTSSVICNREIFPS